MKSSLWHQRLFLLMAPGILAEILSGNTPIFKLFNPVDFFFLVLAYGVPVMLIWEYKVKYRLSFLSIFLLGIAYGIFNEGLIAKTILDTSSVPMDGFVDTTDFFGINWSWSLMILSWHAFFSVLFPIVIAHTLFREGRESSLIGKKWHITFLLLTFVLLPLMATSWQGKISPWLYVAFYGLIFTLFSFARWLKWRNPKWEAGKGIWKGFGLLMVYLYFFIAAGRFSLVLYAIFGIIFIVFALRKFLKLSSYEQSRFALWGYLAFGSFATFITFVNGRYDLFIMCPLLVGLLFYFLRRKKPIE